MREDFRRLALAGMIPERTRKELILHLDRYKTFAELRVKLDELIGYCMGSNGETGETSPAEPSAAIEDA